MSTKSAIPVVPAYHRNDDYCVWCEGCFTWHFHGAGNGSRISHCTKDTPYRETGYNLQYAGELTQIIEINHGHIPADLRPLSDEQLRLLLIVYGDVCKIGQRGRDAWRLLNALEINQSDALIPDDHLSARVTYLRWQLARTPGVRVIRKAVPWRFLFESTSPLIMSAAELMQTVFPEDQRSVEVWLHETMEANANGGYTPVWYAWDMFKAWMHRKGPDYKVTRAEWLKDLGDNGIFPRKVNYYSGQVFEGHCLKDHPW